MTEALPFTRTWLPYIYLYGAGGILFAAGIWVVLRSGSLDLRRPKHKLWFGVLFFGFAWYMTIHAVATLAALGASNTIIILIIVFFILIAFFTLRPVWRSYS